MTFNGKLPLDLIGSNGKQYRIKLPMQSGGKAGKGHNKTSTIQVVYEGVFVVKQIRYNVADILSKNNAIKKALEYAIGKGEAAKYFSTSDIS